MMKVASARSRVSCAAAVGAALLVIAVARADDAPPLLGETFAQPLDQARWETLRFADTKSDRIEAANGRLSLALDTLGTDDATVKLRGVRSRDAFDLGSGVRVETVIDWNGQTNGCYLSAGLALVDAGFDGDPRNAPESVTFEWVGVPPGQNVRPYLTRHKKGTLIELYTEGWPQPKREDRVGRAPKKSRVGLQVSAKGIRLTEDGKELWKGDEGISGKFKLVLFVTGHSNYPERTVYFEGVNVTSLSEEGK